jgi:hypothetical protein
MAKTAKLTFTAIAFKAAQADGKLEGGTWPRSAFCWRGNIAGIVCDVLHRRNLLI